MSAKQVKKIRQLYRREVAGSINIWRDTINDKPRWMPQFVWAIILKIVFKPVVFEDKKTT